MRFPLCALGLLVAGALLLPAAASADDQAVYNVFHRTHPRFQKLRRDFERGERHWENSNYSDPSDAYAACRKTAELARRVKKRMQDRHVSTTTGAKARNRSVTAVEYRKRWADAERTAIESFMDFDGEGYIRLHRNARKHIARAQDYEARAQRLFEQAGVNTNPP
jgi:hypothetical protein